MFKVESNLPIPEKKKGPQARYPFAKMKVGEHFFVPLETAHKARNAANAYKLKHDGWDYTARQTEDGLRIWRIEGETK